MKSNSALHLGIGLTADPKEKYYESALITAHLAEFESRGGKIHICKNGETGRPINGKNRGAMTVAQRAFESKKRQVEGPMAVEPTTTS